MSLPTGRVVSLADDTGVEPGWQHARVTVDAAAVCPRCAAGKGCGAGVFAQGRGPQSIDVRVPANLEIAIGDTVKLMLAPGKLLTAAAIVYGLPLGAAAAAAAAASLAGGGDTVTAAFALGGLVAGMAAGRVHLGRRRCVGRFTPVVVERIAAAGLTAA